MLSLLASGSEGEPECDGELDSVRESAKVISYIHLGEEIDWEYGLFVGRLFLVSLFVLYASQ